MRLLGETCPITSTLARRKDLLKVKVAYLLPLRNVAPYPIQPAQHRTWDRVPHSVRTIGSLGIDGYFYDFEFSQRNVGSRWEGAVRKRGKGNRI
jgi:hypothetical protein